MRNRGVRGRGKRRKTDRNLKGGETSRRSSRTLLRTSQGSHLPTMKRFSGPPRLGSPSPSPGLSQPFTPQQQAHGRSPVTPRAPSYQSYPASPPLITTDSSTSSHSQGPYSTPVLYTCEAVSPFRLGLVVMYDDIGFHRLGSGSFKSTDTLLSICCCRAH